MYSIVKDKTIKVLKVCLSLILILSMVVGMTACTGNTGEETDSIDTIVEETAKMLLDNTDEPVYGSVGGEWVVLGMARWGGEVPEGWFEDYYAGLEDYVKQCNGVLDERKYTEYSRVILALTAMGKDPTNVAGYNLLTPLGDYDKTIFQGINGPIVALLALDSGDYEVPVNSEAEVQATREMYVDYILEQELDNGGWSFSGGSLDVDITAMALQALAKYQDREDVKLATDRALDALSQQQNENGGFATSGADSSESLAQVITAFAELGIDINDERFVKEGNAVVDALLHFRTDDKGFAHILEGNSDAMATEQAFYALVSLNRVQSGQSSLYRM